jgi:type II secretory ATPase GspE/PulE/Tfp pilus assembly ATPase PilB-like protein
MTERQLKTLTASIKENKGIVLVSAPKGQGLTTTLYAILRAHDAFLEHIHTIEGPSDTDLEGITQNRLPAGAPPAEEVKLINWVGSQEPEVLMVSNISEGKSAQSLAKLAATGRRVYVGLRGSSTFETLSTWRKLVGDDKLAMADLQMVINCRVLRRLCAACKVGYSPDPGTLRKLNMDPDKVGKLFQARTEPIRDPKGNPIPCEFCKELHFKGRVGVYETLVIDDEVRAMIESGGSVNQLKALFRKQRGKYLQEQALAQVEAGETSIQEVLRVMKPPEGSSSSGSSRSSSRPPSAPK